MAIDPNEISTARVDQLPEQPWAMSDRLPKATGTELKQNTVQTLADFISAYIGTVSSLAFNPTPVPDGGTLPVTSSPEFILLGKGTFHNVGGGADIVTTEELNAATSNGLVWTLAVQIPIDVELAGIVQTIRQGYTSTTPSENVLFDALGGKTDTGGYPGSSQDIANLVSGKVSGDLTAGFIPVAIGPKQLNDSQMAQTDECIRLGNLRPPFSIGFSVSRYSEIMNRHIYEDYSLFNPSTGGSGIGIFDASTELMGSADNAHMMAYQSRLKYTASGNLLDSFGLTGLIVLNSHEGSGDILKAHGVLINDVGGSGAIGENYGLKIENIARGLTRWAIYSDGGDSQFKGDLYNANGKGFFSFMHGDKNSTDSQSSAFVNDGKTVFYSMGKGAYSPGNFIFRTFDGTTISDLAELTTGGNLGLNKSSPTYKIDAVGADNFGFRYKGSAVEAIMGVSPTVAQFGSKTNHTVQIVVNEAGVATFDASGNFVASGTAKASPATLGDELVTLDQLNAVSPSGIKRYKALITQTGTSAPTVTILENSIGDITYGYTSAGAYTANSSGLFTSGKTFLFLNPTYGTGNYTAIKYNSSNILDIKSLNGITPTDGILSAQSLLIEVYP
jgi:hypothetical protein